MKKIILIIMLLGVTVNGCAPVLEMMPGFKHTAALIIGETKNNVLAQTEHLLGKPKQVAYAFKGTPDEFETKRYAFTNVYDLVLYFHNDIFFQADLMEPESERYPDFREDYKEVRKGAFGPIGYMLVIGGGKATINTLWREGEEPK